MVQQAVSLSAGTPRHAPHWPALRSNSGTAALATVRPRRAIIDALCCFAGYIAAAGRARLQHRGGTRPASVASGFNVVRCPRRPASNAPKPSPRPAARRPSDDSDDADGDGDGDGSPLSYLQTTSLAACLACRPSPAGASMALGTYRPHDGPSAPSLAPPPPPPPPRRAAAARRHARRQPPGQRRPGPPGGRDQRTAAKSMLPYPPPRIPIRPADARTVPPRPSPRLLIGPAVPLLLPPPAPSSPDDRHARPGS